MNCINCNNEHEENFCPNCGENSSVKMITINAMLEDSATTVFNMDKGFLYNLKKLTTDPHLIVNNYLRGKRKGIYNPLAFLFVSVTIYIIADVYLKDPIQSDQIDSAFYKVGYNAGEFVKTYFKYFWILSIIWLATSTKLMFRKFNFAEHLAISAFVIGYATLISLIGFVIFEWDILFNPFVYLTISWLLYKVFKNKNEKTESIILALTSTFLFFIQLVLIIACIGLLKTYL